MRQHTVAAARARIRVARNVIGRMDPRFRDRKTVVIYSHPGCRGGGKVGR